MRVVFFPTDVVDGKLPSRKGAFITSSPRWQECLAELNEGCWSTRKDGGWVAGPTHVEVRARPMAERFAASDPTFAREADLLGRWSTTIPKKAVAWIAEPETGPGQVPLPIVSPSRGTFGAPVLDEVVMRGQHRGDVTLLVSHDDGPAKPGHVHLRVAGKVSRPPIPIAETRGRPSASDWDVPALRSVASSDDGSHVAWLWTDKFRHQLMEAQHGQGRECEHPSIGELVIARVGDDVAPIRLPVGGVPNLSLQFVRVRGRLLLVHAFAKTVRGLDPMTGEVIATFGSFDDLSPARATIAAGTTLVVVGKAAVEIVNLESGETRSVPHSKAVGNVVSVDASPSGRYLLASTNGQERHVWDLATGRAWDVVVPPSQTPAAFLPDESALVTAHYGGSMHVVSLDGRDDAVAKTWRPPLRRLETFDPTMSLVSPDGRYVALCSERNVTQVTVVVSLSEGRLEAVLTTPLDDNAARATDIFARDGVLWAMCADGVYTGFDAPWFR